MDVSCPMMRQVPVATVVPEPAAPLANTNSDPAAVSPGFNVAVPVVCLRYAYVPTASTDAPAVAVSTWLVVGAAGAAEVHVVPLEVSTFPLDPGATT